MSFHLYLNAANCPIAVQFHSIINQKYKRKTGKFQVYKERKKHPMKDFLPVCREDMEKRGWQEVDFVYVCGDAYVDHPSFGAAIIMPSGFQSDYQEIFPKLWQQTQFPEILCISFLC